MNNQEEANNERGQLVSVETLRSMLEDSLPQDDIVYAFGYGSGVLSQQQSSTTAKQQNDTNDSQMIDFVVVVRDSHRFHKDNLDVNPDHYAAPFWFATDRAARVTWWQRYRGLDTKYFRNPCVYFNVTDRFKYGIVQVDDLARDLSYWTYLYLAGRMQKPVVTIVDREIRSDTRMTIQHLQDQCNLPAALSASLLLLQNNNNNNETSTATVDDCRLYQQIASLSYSGDPRMTAGAEDPDKVSKLVQTPGQLPRFRQQYQDALKDLETTGVLSVSTETVGGSSAAKSLSWDSSSPTARKLLWDRLPPGLQGTGDNDALATTLASIVAPAARYQSMKGLATAGLRRSWSYAARKLSKGLLRR